MNFTWYLSDSNLKQLNLRGEEEKEKGGNPSYHSLTINNSIFYQQDLLLATVTHDLKAPLVSVIYYTKLLQNEISDKKEGNINEYLDIIECNSILLQNLVMDIQDLSQIK